jgi:hypothetical protein
MKKFNRVARFEVLTYYAKGTPKCSCCEEARIEFLTIDHIKGGGTKERKSFKSARNTYYWLKKQGLPEGFRVLCMNCNFSLGKYGYCPHSKVDLA